MERLSRAPGRHPFFLTILLSAYIAGVVASKLVSNDPNGENDMVQTVSAGAFAGVAWILAFHGGGMAQWPTILPLAFFQAIALGTYVLLKYIVTRKLVQRIDRFVTTIAVAFFAVMALYTIIPQQDRWAQHIGAILCVLCGLPLAYAIPTIINTKHKTLDKEEVSKALLASELVYSRGKSDAFKEVEFVHNRETGSRCGVYVDTKSDSKTIYIAFAGSDSNTDWIRTNLAVATEPYTTCHADAGQPIVHQGFLKAWRSIQEPVWGKVSDVVLRQGGSGKIVVCGHSLGGATATLAAPDIACRLEKQYLPTFATITFGSPRVGNKDFKELFNRVVAQSVRVAGLYDPVAKLVINDFVHVDRELVVACTHNIGGYKKAVQKMAR